MYMGGSEAAPSSLLPSFPPSLRLSGSLDLWLSLSLFISLSRAISHDVCIYAFLVITIITIIIIILVQIVKRTYYWAGWPADRPRLE